MAQTVLAVVWFFCLVGAVVGMLEDEFAMAFAFDA